MQLGAEDVQEITRLGNLYGHIIDNKQWDQVHFLFTDDVIYDATDFGYKLVVGASSVAAHWMNPAVKHPIAHHATNIVVELDHDNNVQMRSKGLSVAPTGIVYSVDYIDLLRQTSNGWRIAKRLCLKRSPREKVIQPE